MTFRSRSLLPSLPPGSDVHVLEALQQRLDQRQELLQLKAQEAEDKKESEAVQTFSRRRNLC